MAIIRSNEKFCNGTTAGGKVKNSIMGLIHCTWTIGVWILINFTHTNSTRFFIYWIVIPYIFDVRNVRQRIPKMAEWIRSKNDRGVLYLRNLFSIQNFLKNVSKYIVIWILLLSWNVKFCQMTCWDFESDFFRLWKQIFIICKKTEYFKLIFYKYLNNNWEINMVS